MSDDNGQRDVQDASAPWGINPATGKPYRRDPAPFAHLRRDPAAPKTKTTAAPAAKPDAEDKAAARYSKRIAGWLRGLIRLIKSRDQIDAAVVAIQAPKLADAWGRVAVDYPRLGALIDRVGPGGSLSEAASLTLLTAGVILARHGLLGGTPVEGFLIGYMNDLLVEAGVAERVDQADDANAPVPVPA
jgi:hypothetical protein